MITRRHLMQSMLSALASLGLAVQALGQGQVVAWGWNFSGIASTRATSLLRVLQVAAGDVHSVGVRQDGSVECWGVNYDRQCNVPIGLGEVKQVGAGCDFTVALLADQTVRFWGMNRGWPAQSSTSNVVQIAAGRYHVVTLRTGGEVACFGSGDWGSNSPPAGLGPVTRVGAGEFLSLGLRTDGGVSAWGKNDVGQCNVPADLAPVRNVGAGSSHVIALTTAGHVVAWGGNDRGQCDVPAGLDSVQDIAVGLWHTVALKADGTVSAWGYNLQGQCDSPAGLSGVTQIAAGGYHSIALRADGMVSWGNNSEAQLRPASTLDEVVQVASGWYHAVACRSDGTVAAWGQNQNGMADVPAGLSGVVQVTAGYSHSAALRNDGSVVVWGVFPTPAPVNPGFITQLESGRGMMIGLRIDGTVAPWGTAVPDDLAGVIEIAAGDGAKGAIRGDGTVRVWGSTRAAEAASMQTSCVGLDVAETHAAAVRADQSVVCWGAAGGGACNVPADLGPVIKVAVDNDRTLALRVDGTVRAWGNGQFGAWEPPAGLANVVDIDLGPSQGVALLSGGVSRCSNMSGAGVADLTTSGAAWRNVGIWSWRAGVSPQVPGSLTQADLGNFGSVGSDCAAQCQTLTARSGTSVLVPASASAAGNDFSIRVGSTANLAGRLWLLGVDGAGSTLPEDLNIPVLSAGSVNGNFDLIQSELPPPAGFFLTLVPEDVNGRTVFSLRLLPLPGGGELTASSAGSFTGKAVAAETIDINHDGFDDLALAVDFGASQNGLIQILLNDGAGGLGSTSVLASIPPQPTCLAVGDIDGDGDRDVAVGIGSDLTARVYLDNGTGGLTASTVYSGLGGSPVSVAIVQGAGSSLMAASGSVVVGTSGSKLKIFMDGALQQEIALAGTPTTLRPGKNDVIRPTGINTGGTRTASIDGLLPVAETGFVQTFTLAPSGLFELGQTMFITAKPVGMDVADLDGDGLDDIVTTNTDPQLPAVGSALPVLSIFRNSGGTFGGGVPYQPATASSGLDVSLIDVDNDGDRDIVSVYKRVGSDSEAALLRVDTLGPGTPISIGQTTVLDASDPILSARGNLDGSGGEDLFLVNRPSGSFLTGVQEVKPFLATGALKQGDLDGDGTVSASDISILLLDFGPCPGCLSDLDGSGEVDGGDLSFLLLLFD